jgi:hypothetical protein
LYHKKHRQQLHYATKVKLWKKFYLDWLNQDKNEEKSAESPFMKFNEIIKISIIWLNDKCLKDS